MDLSKNVLKGGALELLYNWEKPVQFKLEGTTCDSFLLPETCVAFLNHTSNREYQLIALEHICTHYRFEEVPSFLDADGVLTLLSFLPFKAVADPFQEAALDVVCGLVRNSVSIQNAVIEFDAARKLLGFLSVDLPNTELEGLYESAASLMLALCGNNSVAGLAAVREIEGVGLALGCVVGTNHLPYSTTKLANLFADVRHETPSIQEDLENSQVIEKLLNADWEYADVYPIPCVTCFAFGNAPTCQIILRDGAVPYILELIEVPGGAACGSELVQAMASADQGCWLALCEAGAIPTLARALEGMVAGTWKYEAVVGALRALSTPFFALDIF